MYGKVVSPRWGYGFAKYLRDSLPNTVNIAFTGAPIELEDALARQVFGCYIDISQTVEDCTTIRIYYECH